MVKTSAGTPLLNQKKNKPTASAKLETAGESVCLRSSTQLHQFSPARIVFANCEADIVSAVSAAAAKNLPIRAIGVMHSYEPIFATTGVCLVLERYIRLIEVEAQEVTVQAGMTLAALNKQLAQRGLALPIVSAIALQTVSGAISTGTHGGSYHHPSLSGYIRRLRLVRADGSVITLCPTDAEFDAAAISMGLLGVISTVTFACVPAFWLAATRQALSADDFVTQFDSIHRNNQYVDVKYVPITDRMQVLTMNFARSESAVSSIFSQSTADTATRTITRRVKTQILKQMLALFQKPHFQWLQYLMFRHHEDNIYPVYQCDRSDHIFTALEHAYYDPISLHNMEIAVPYSQAPAVLQALRQHFRQTRCYPNIFIRLRVAAAEPFWLSPAYSEPVCWFDFCEYPYSGAFFREIVDLLAPFNFRSHWGKEIQAAPAYVQARYERWADFVELRDRWDPNRLFANPSLDRFFTTDSQL